MSKNRSTLTLPRRAVAPSPELTAALDTITKSEPTTRVVNPGPYLPGEPVVLGPGETIHYPAPASLRVELRKLDPRAVVPKYQSAGAAAFDIHAINSGTVTPGETFTVHTGLALWHRDPAWGLFVFARGGLGTVKGIRPGNCVGVCDSDYQGELLVVLRNDSAVPFVVREGDRVAQAALMPVAQAVFAEVDQFSETTVHGEGRQGSTGK
jgi:dUTP pyrophosphatase